MAEITDAQLAELQQSHALLKSLYADSAVGFDFKKLIKKKYPNAVMPDLDAVVKTEELGTGLTEKFAEIEKTLTGRIDAFLGDRKKERDEQDVNRFADRVNEIKKARGYTDEGVEKLLTTMKERGIQNIDDAVIIFETNQPKPKTTPKSYSTRMDFVSPDGKDDESFKQLMADPEQWMGDQLLSAIHADASAEE